MTWRPELAGGCEAAKIAAVVVPYLQGRCLDIGSGPGKVWPSLIGIDIEGGKGRPITDMAMDGTKLGMFTDASFDGVFSSFLLHQVERSKVPAVLAEWSRVLKVGGHLVLYLPSANFAPRSGAEDADERQKWDILPGDIEALLRAGETHWELLESEERGRGDEYGLLIVARKTGPDAPAWVENVWQRNPDGRERALIIRYGAIGDALIAASVLPGLKAQGYHITFMCHPGTETVLRHDPHIDEWCVQVADFVPNEVLGPYWSMLQERYDKIINLCESVEGVLLALPGRLNHSYSDEARRKICGHVNYLERTHDLAGVPYVFDGRFYPTEMERKWAAAVRRTMDGPVICWSVNGSSPHKVYPWTQVVAKWLAERTPAHVMLYGDPGVGKELQDGIISCLEAEGVNMARIHPVAGKWAIRQSLAFAQVADCIVGPETGPLNAMAMEPVAKVIYLSHSSAENLTKHWRNTTTLVADASRAPCAPCHRLHYDWSHCFRSEKTSAALCASAISPEAAFEAIAMNIGARKAA
jgi:ADP-heptose:LPS heptosyltransferase